MSLKLFSAVLFSIFSIGVLPATECIPLPKKVSMQEGSFSLKPVPVLFSDKRLDSESRFLLQELKKLNLGASVQKGNSPGGGILLRIDSALSVPESYTIGISPEGITIAGHDPAGVFYGIQTLLQEITAVRENKGTTLPCQTISDAPRYHWRGYMLDEARHFFGKEKVKQLLDLMARYKLNKFHWHLTDEPGWRLEIKKYPLLAKTGGKGSWSRPDQGEPLFYTQKDIREIVQYAAARHIEIIPEIDMPGHATAANKAYPQFSGGGTKDHPDFTFNPGNEATYTFLTDILKETAALFPSQYIHLGGDEVSFGIKSWETDPQVQALMKKEGLKNVKEVEAWFMRRMAKVTGKMGKTLVGWDELLDSGVAPADTVIMWWRHDKPQVLKNSLSKGYRTILCPRRPLYFDFIQDGSHKWGRTWSGFCPLEDVYTFPDKGLASWNLPSDKMNLIQGIQANLWTERVQNEKRLDFLTYPRLCALAESAWSAPETKDYENFTKRMDHSYRLFDELGLYYFDNRNPEKHPEPVGAEKENRKMPLDFRD